jgi:hypothetical protein
MRTDAREPGHAQPGDCVDRGAEILATVLLEVETHAERERERPGEIDRRIELTAQLPEVPIAGVREEEVERGAHGRVLIAAAQQVPRPELHDGAEAAFHVRARIERLDLEARVDLDVELGRDREAHADQRPDEEPVEGPRVGPRDLRLDERLEERVRHVPLL